MRDGDVERALTRARAFVAGHGSALARTRMEALLGTGAAQALPLALRPLQAPSGAFASPGAGKDAGPGVAGTLQALAMLDDLRGLDCAEVEHAVRYLERVQREDGSWAATASDPAGTRVVVSGLLGGYLAKTRCVRPPVLDAAGAFLAAHWDPERLQRGDYGALVAFAHFFSNAPHELSDAALQWCGRELERQFRSGRLDALRTARVFTLCDAEALPGARVCASELVCGLLAQQRPDGGWRSGPGRPEPRVAATLEAALALRRLAGAR